MKKNDGRRLTSELGTQSLEKNDNWGGRLGDYFVIEDTAPGNERRLRTDAALRLTSESRTRRVGKNDDPGKGIVGLLPIGNTER